MKIFLISLLGIFCAFAYQPTPLEEGQKAPDFTLPGVDGRDYRLSDFTGGKVTVVIFTTNHCPDAIASHGRMITLVDHFKDQPVKFVAINSNSPEGLHLAELGWTRYDDGFEDMKKIAEDTGFNLPYLYDGETQEVAKAYGAVATPHVFIFDESLALRYNGRLDNGKRRLGPVEKNEARDAIQALLEGKKIEVVKTRPAGCSTKWKEKATLVAQRDEAWKKNPVTLEVAGPDLIQKIAKNEGRSGMRLINLWSTSCGPCVTEFPDLVSIYRQYSWQKFEFIPVSLDRKEDQQEVLDFLKDHHCGLDRKQARFVKEDGRTTNNYLFDGDADQLAEALDPTWNGGLPYTLLIGPDGEILYRHSGALTDSTPLKKKILAQVWDEIGKR